MPAVRKLDIAEVQTLERKSLGLRKAIATEYDRYLADFAPGDYGEVRLDTDEKRLTVRNRLKAAAERHDPALALVFQRVRGDDIRFKVVPASEAPAPAPSKPRKAAAAAIPVPAPVAEVVAPAKRRGPAKKSAAAAPAEAPKPRGRRKATAGA